MLCRIVAITEGQLPGKTGKRTRSKCVASTNYAVGPLTLNAKEGNYVLPKFQNEHRLEIVMAFTYSRVTAETARGR